MIKRKTGRQKGCIPHNKGKTLEELYGKEKAEQISNKMRKIRLGKKHSKETKEKHKKYMLENPIKYWLGKKRKPFSKETRKKMSLAQLGKKHSEKSKKKMSNAKMGQPGFWKGKKRNHIHIMSDEAKEKIRKASTGRKHTEETKEKLRQINLGKKYSESTKNKHRENAITNINRTMVDGKIMRPFIGKNETDILDNIEAENKIKLIRQYRVCGYFVDGYDKENNIVYEVDEQYHRNKTQREKDKIRQENIVKELNCEFVRIKDY